jgi:hypothetical protein
MIWPSHALQQAGFDVDILDEKATFPTTIQDSWYRQQVPGVGTKLVKIPHVIDVVPPDADVVVVQRPLRRSAVEIVEILKRKGKRIVIELDDDFECVPTRNVAWKDVHPRMSPDRNYLWVRKAVELADVVTVSTPALAQRYGRFSQRPPIVLPNCVPEIYTRIVPIPHEGRYIGWSGAVKTHPDDLQVTRGAVAQTARTLEIDIAVIGDGEMVHRYLGMSKDQELVCCGWVPIRDYPMQMAQIDVGIVPLDLCPFNHAKSWLKGLEFAALRVPYVASPTGPYRLAFAAGAGRLASRPQDWSRELRRLFTDDDHRAEIIAGGYEFAQHWTYEKQAERWWDAWAQALQ